jgi:hypothetical protein
LNVQAGLSLDTFANEIAEPGATLVFATSAFEYGHEPEAPAVEADRVVRAVLQVGVAAVLPLPPQAVIRTPHAASRARGTRSRG